MQNNPENTLQDAAKQQRDYAFDAWQKADQCLFQCLVIVLSVTGRSCTDDWLAASDDLNLAPDALLDGLDGVQLPEDNYLRLAAIHVMLVKAMSAYVEVLSASADYLAAEESLAALISGVSQAGEVSH